MRPEIKSNGQECYEHVLSCTDDSLVVSEEAEEIIRNQIGKCFVVKKGSIFFTCQMLRAKHEKSFIRQCR